MPASEIDVDHVAAAGGDHRLQGGDGAVHRPQRVDLEHRPARRLVLLPGRPGDQHAGVVDPEVERAAARRGFGGERPAGRLVAHVERRRARPGADLGRGAGGRVGVDVGDVDEVAAAGQLEGDRATEAAARSRDDGHRHRLRQDIPMHLSSSPSRLRATIAGRAERLRGERKPLEESPDTTGQGGG